MKTPISSQQAKNKDENDGNASGFKGYPQRAPVKFGEEFARCGNSCGPFVHGNLICGGQSTKIGKGGFEVVWVVTVGKIGPVDAYNAGIHISIYFLIECEADIAHLVGWVACEVPSADS